MKLHLAILVLLLVSATSCHKPSPTPVPPPPPVGLYVLPVHCTAPVVGKLYQCQFKAAGGTKPYHWSVAGALPPGLKLDDNGLMSGMAQQYGRYQYQVVVTDSSGRKAASKTY